MTEHLVNCARKKSPGTRPEHITHIGGPSFGTLSVVQAIQKIEANTDNFYTGSVKSKAYVRIVRLASGEKYLRTLPDESTSDNLLHLPACT
jgi:hypothetical protein